MSAARRKRGTFEQVVGTPIECARKRVDLIERFGGTPDAADVALLADAEQHTEGAPAGTPSSLDDAISDLLR